MIEDEGDLTRIAFLIACFDRYLGGVDDDGVAYDIFEPRISQADWQHLRGGDPLAVLDIEAFRGLQLRSSPRFVAAFQQISDQLKARGTAETLTRLLV